MKEQELPLHLRVRFPVSAEKLWKELGVSPTSYPLSVWRGRMVRKCMLREFEHYHILIKGRNGVGGLMKEYYFTYEAVRIICRYWNRPRNAEVVRAVMAKYDEPVKYQGRAKMFPKDFVAGDEKNNEK